MKKEDEEKVSGLPENAYRELKEGEVYKPILSPDKQYREVTPWSVFWGLVMAVLFGSSFPRTESWTGIRSRHPDRDHSSRIIQRVQT